MFERLIDLILQAGERIMPFAIVNAWEKGVVLRLGKFHRSVGPGLAWKIPFAEDVIQHTAVTTTMRLAPQTLTTKDGKAVVVAAVVKYNVHDVEKYSTQVWDQHDALADVTMGEIRVAVRDHTFEELLAEVPEKAIATAVRRKIGKYGIELEAVTFTDLAAVRSFRLIQQAVKDLDN